MSDIRKNVITYEEKDGYVLVKQTCGPDLAFAQGSRVRIIERDGLAFKSFDGSDTLLPYCDWRLPAEQRAEDLASRMSIEEIAGLMLYSPQNRIPMATGDTYRGKAWSESGEKEWAVSDGQRRFLLEDKVRHVLVSKVSSPEAAARWNNAIQAIAENDGLGIPANNSSDPRHSAFADAEFSPGASGQLSLWSNLMGLASTFDPQTVCRFANIASREYRALGLATALSPQADLGTDPRWYRFNATFGCDPVLVSDLVRAYCEGFQGSPDVPEHGWGRESVNTMVKHWPGGGSGEGGRDAHYGNGKFAVYPGGCFEMHKYPFIHGAFNLPGATGKASAVMPYYTISYNQTSENVGNSFNHELIEGQLRGENHYDGVVCTDWIITADATDPGVHSAKPWGVETLSESERHYKALMAGVDQFGGNDKKAPVLEAYHMGCLEHGEDYMRRRFERSAARLLLNSFRPGLFENPYVDPLETAATVGCSEWMCEGFEQQLRSIVMLKNHGNVLPLKPGITVFIPRRKVPETLNFWRTAEAALDYLPFADAACAPYFRITDKPEEADIALVYMESPKSAWMGYDIADRERGGNGYIPISLQYRPYTAREARAESIAGDPHEAARNRSYLGKTAHAQNECELDMLEETRRVMGRKPVIVAMNMNNPTVMAEIDAVADAILIGFSVQNQAFAELLTGRTEPSGLLPFELPASMEAVEHHCEDKPHDIEPYRDTDGNIYEFGFGLSFSGRISDSRTRKYCGK